MVLLDQTRLPGERVERSCRTVAELIDAIQVLAIRGAPALGVAGAMGIALAARTAPEHPVGMRQYLAEQGAVLAAARPTAVNLAWGVGEALTELDREVGNPHEARGRIAARARRIQDEEVARCRAMGAHGATLFADGAHLMTQCNTGGARDRRLRHRARRRPARWPSAAATARLGARDAAVAAGRAPDGLRAGRGRHPAHPRRRQRDRRDPA